MLINPIIINTTHKPAEALPPRPPHVQVIEKGPMPPPPNMADLVFIKECARMERGG